ncbi:pyridine nucleotide-disulfide oxidoreductase [Fischerella major NIES-592]|uniref:Pyridine nucleotide-disulfide oxidoreductase n=1 Tax=Fischerella major NIES-592 TaxID=210994 RepID=A0A1U7GUQ4_9CYAN|nr:FAD/NAD(P)-binding oxidoreductase [Fischerella major]OKH11794.1 pyridine nucleotide-disulfide oxidoreductase [Fischerella major NIES-592]
MSSFIQKKTNSPTSTDTSPIQETHHYQIVIVGGGAAGITVASQLCAKNSKLDIAILEPKAQHYYQPAWTLVGGGEYSINDTVKPQASCIPKGVTWIQDYATELNPDENAVITRSGKQIYYDYLVLCPGIQIDWHLIEGLQEALGKGGVCSNYAFEYAPYTWEVIRSFQGGNALFTFPGTPIKCGGAPQKIMYMADDAFQRQGVSKKTNVMFCSAVGAIFPVPAYAERLLKVVDRRHIQVKFKHNLKAIRAAAKEAVFDVTTDEGTQQVTIPYDMIHVTPPMSAPDFIKTSKLAASTGWVDVDKQTLQHNQYPNVFSLGDASSLPTSKTAAAIRRQAPVLVENLLALINSTSMTGSYNGYTCCPLITGYGKVIMAEFDYNNQPISTFPIDPREERYSMWLVKRHVLPWVYWNRMLKGKQFEGDVLKLKGWKQPTNDLSH